MGPDELKPNGEGQPDKTPVSYESELDADVRAAFDEVGKAPAESVDELPEPADKGGEQPRDPKGRFARKEGESDGAAGNEKSADGQLGDRAAAEEGTPQGQETDGGVRREDKPPAELVSQAAGPPPSWSVASKVAWDALPDHVRADIAKRESEVKEGFAALRDYKELKPYAEMAQRSGTTLSAALHRYTNMEQLARRDPARGLMTIAQNMGLSKEQAGQLFSQLAGTLGARPTGRPQSNGGAPFTDGPDQNDPLAEVIAPLIERALGPVTSKLGTLESHLSERQLADQNARSRTVAEAIEKFSADPQHRYFPDLEETISRLFETGMVEQTADPLGDLTKAYEMAAQLHPEVREALVSERLKAKSEEAKAKERDEAAKAKAASRSITGSATDGTDASRGKRRAGMSYEADLEADVRAAFDGRA